MYLDIYFVIRYKLYITMSTENRIQSFAKLVFKASLHPVPNYPNSIQFNSIQFNSVCLFMLET